MGKILKFQIDTDKTLSVLSNEIESDIKKLPQRMGICLKESFNDISSLSVIHQKSFNLVVPDNLTSEERLVIEEGVNEIIKHYQTDLLTILKRLALKEAELCMLKSKCGQ